MQNEGISQLISKNARPQTGCLAVDSGNLQFNLEIVPAADRPQGFRFSKYITVLKATAGRFAVQGAGESLGHEDEAFEKAKSEVLERLSLQAYCAQRNVEESSSGWAAHTDFYSARLAAAIELFERDAALVQWFREKPMLQIEPSEMPFQLKWWRWAELSLSEFPILNVFLTTEGLYPAVVALLRNKNGNGVIGTASSTDLKSAIESAIAEACRSAHHFIRSTFADQVDLIFQNTDVLPKPGAHTVLYAKRIAFPDWFLNPIEKIDWKTANALFDEQSVEAAIKNARLRFEQMASGERVVLKAHGENVQRVFWGHTRIENLNLQRIGRGIESINTHPHPVG